MLTNLEIVILSAVIAICVVAAWTTGQQPSSMSLIFNAPSIARSVPAGAFGSAKSLLREADGSFDQVWLGPFLSLP
jgi:hypothetical protein